MFLHLMKNEVGSNVQFYPIRKQLSYRYESYEYARVDVGLKGDRVFRQLMHQFTVWFSLKNSLKYSSRSSTKKHSALKMLTFTIISLKVNHFVFACLSLKTSYTFLQRTIHYLPGNKENEVNEIKCSVLKKSQQVHHRK